MFINNILFIWLHIHLLTYRGNSYNNEYDRRRLTALRKRHQNIRKAKSTDKFDRKYRKT